MSIITLWCATSAEQLGKIAHRRWREFPPDQGLRTTLSVEEAVAGARELARAQGDGFVVELNVASSFLEDHPTGHVPVEAAEELSKALGSAIVERAHYRKGLSENELAAEEANLGTSLPRAWRNYLRKDAWFHRGWMRSGAYVWLYSPDVSAELLAIEAVSGMLVIGSDGGGEQLAVDLREPSPRVMLVNVVRTGWAEALLQAASLEEFVKAIEQGTFDFSFV